MMITILHTISPPLALFSLHCTDILRLFVTWQELTTTFTRLCCSAAIIILPRNSSVILHYYLKHTVHFKYIWNKIQNVVNGSWNLHNQAPSFRLPTLPAAFCLPHHAPAILTSPLAFENMMLPLPSGNSLGCSLFLDHSVLGIHKLPCDLDCCSNVTFLRRSLLDHLF